MAVKSDKKVAARPKRSRAETQVEFAVIEAEHATSGPLDSKASDLHQAHAKDVADRVRGIDVESVVRGLASLGLDVSRSLGDISEKLVAEVERLADLREAVALERDELDRLHKIDIAATTLDQLLEDHARNKQAFEAEMAETRAAWKQEAAQAERERREQDDTLKKQRQREAEDYEYKKTLERKKAQDKYDEEQRQTARQNAERQEALAREWQQREAVLKAQEEDVARLRTEVGDFPARLAREVATAVEDERRRVAADFERQLLILKKDAEAEARLSDLRVKALEASVATGAAQIAALEKQLAEAKQQVQDIAVRAIDGASGARALGHINQIAMEQAKNRPQG